MKSKLSILLILILGLVLRLISLNQSYWLDEATSALTAKNFSVTQIVSNFTPGDFHPPFYYLLLKFWISIVGESEIKTRLLSVLFGLGVIFSTYLITRLFLESKKALLASLLVATSPLLIYYSQEARMYMLATFLVSISIYIFLITLRKNNIYLWVWFACTLILIFATDYLPVLLLPVFWIWALIKVKDKIWWKGFIFAHIPLIIFVTLYSPILLTQVQAGLSVKTLSPGWWKVLGETNFKELILIFIKFIFGRISFTNKYIYLTLSLAASSIYVFSLSKALKKKNLLLWLWLVLPVILGFFIGLKLSVFSYFRFIFIEPAFLILTTIGVFRIGKTVLRNSIICFLIASGIIFSSIYLFSPNFHRENWRDLVTFVDKESVHKNSRIIFASNSQMEALKYYSPKTAYTGPTGIDRNLDQIWLMRYVQDIFDPQDNVRKEIESFGFSKSGEYNFNGVVVWRYIK